MAPGFLLRTARSARRLTAVAAAAAAITAGAAGAAPAAQAASHPAVARHAVSRAAAGHQMIPARVITCRIHIIIRFPHPLNATGKLICSRRVARITLRVTIFRGRIPVHSRAFTRTGVRGLIATIGATCVTGRYRATAVGRVRTRTGKLLTGSAATRRVRVIC